MDWLSGKPSDGGLPEAFAKNWTKILIIKT
jgi:hypothetical protein